MIGPGRTLGVLVRDGDTWRAVRTEEISGEDTGEPAGSIAHGPGCVTTLAVDTWGPAISMHRIGDCRVVVRAMEVM